MRNLEVLVRVTVGCPGCVGYGCMACGKSGRVPATCRLCPEPAYFLRAGLPRCPACFYRCAICAELTPHDDRVPLPGGTPEDVAHTMCTLVGSVIPEFLEVPLLADTPFPTVGARARERANARAHVTPLGDDMPKPSDELIREMRSLGFISTTEAKELTGHSSSTLYEWVAKKKLGAMRSGLFHFVELTGLEKLCPQLQRRREAVS